MSEEQLDIIKEFTVSIALEAGSAIKNLQESDLVEIDYKGTSNNLVTTADLAADKIIVSAIKAKFPPHKILSEESSSDTNNLASGDLWVIDPIDGTTNFSYGSPFTAVSIAYLKDGVAQVGVVYAPFSDELFVGVIGKGSTLNGNRIKTRTTTNVSEALIATGFPYERDNIAEIGDRLTRLLEKCRDIRRFGASSLDICWVACGRLDAYYEDVKPWDMAAGALIAKESGASVSSYKENAESLPPSLHATGFVTACTESLCNELLNVL